MRMGLWEKFVSAVSVAVICGGLTYAYDREHLSRADLNPVFQQINRQYFNGELSGVRVEWQTMDNRLGEAEKLGEHDYRIWIDRRENTSLADVRDTLRHEACHVFVDWKESEEHGAMFQDCMKRFSGDLRPIALNYNFSNWSIALSTPPVPTWVTTIL
jgi:hypothetical protein